MITDEQLQIRSLISDYNFWIVVCEVRGRPDLAKFLDLRRIELQKKLNTPSQEEIKRKNE